MRKLLIGLSLLALQGCYEDVSDLQQYMEEVKTNSRIRVEPIPSVKDFVHVDYNMVSPRSPFELPTPEAVQENFVPVQNCLAPDPRRRKQPLEKFALDNLSMQGTLGANNEVWALVQASDGSLHRVTRGNYIGLFNGRIVSVTDNLVELVELIPDGAGCWKERNSSLQMTEDDEEE
jgi:type IV pilus assembly protein PilP